MAFVANGGFLRFAILGMRGPDRWLALENQERRPPFAQG
jgi:hypothetical protein